MANEPTTKTRLDLNIGADVYCNDGRCGKLSRVVIDPRSERVTDLVVEKGFLQKEDRVIPVSAIDTATGSEIRLDIDAETYEKFAQYDEESVRLPASGYRGAQYEATEVLYSVQGYGSYGSITLSRPTVPTVEHTIHEGVPTRLEVLSSGTPVRNAHGELGDVDHLLINRDTNWITHVIVKTNDLFSDYPIVPIGDIDNIDEEGVYLEMSEEELGAYPRYKPRG